MRSKWYDAAVKCEMEFYAQKWKIYWLAIQKSQSKLEKINIWYHFSKFWRRYIEFLKILFRTAKNRKSLSIDRRTQFRYSIGFPVKNSVIIDFVKIFAESLENIRSSEGVRENESWCNESHVWMFVQDEGVFGMTQCDMIRYTWMTWRYVKSKYQLNLRKLIYADVPEWRR